MTPTDGDAPLRFGRYMVKRELGQGGMGLVYLAEDPSIGREVAIKIIRAVDEDTAEFHTQIRKRFEIEVRAAGNLSHPNIVTIFDVGGQDDCSYVAMEYVRGESLESVMQAERTLSFKEISDLTVQVCRALDYAHENQIVHRDIKPANVLLTADGIPKIVDFGVAKTLATGSEAGTRLTQVGTIIGTPAYMSPEQVTGHDVTAASDQFSLAVIVYEMLAGCLPFQGDGPTTVMYRIVHEDPPTLRSFNKRLPGKIDAVVLRALAKAPDDRYPTCTDFARAVREVLRSAPHETDLSDAEAQAIDATIILPTLSDGTDGTIVLQRGAAVDDTSVLPSSADPQATVMLGGAPVAAGAPAGAPAAEATLAAAPTPPKPAGSRLRVILLAALLVVAVAVVAMIALTPGSVQEPELPAATPPVAAPAGEPASPTSETAAATRAEDTAAADSQPVEATWWLQVNPFPAGSQIFVDGADTGLISPAEVQIAGASGELVQVELRRDGVAIAATELTLGPFMAKEWPLDASPVEAGAVAEGLFVRGIQVRSSPSGSEIWLDGQDLGLRTPAEVRLEGEIGDRYRLELRRDGRRIADTQVILGPNMAAEWDPDAPATARSRDAVDAGRSPAAALTSMTVTSRPAGARVAIDGDDRGTTPLQVDLDLAARHSIRLELDGYEAASWAFTESDLSSSQRDSNTLHFPLTPDTPPATLRVIAPDYAVVVTVAGRSYPAAARHEIRIPSGSHEVTITAQEVFLSQTMRIDLPAEGEREIPLPVALPIQIAATPGNCRVSIDGRFVDVTPFRSRVVAGEHEFEFFWPALGRTVKRTERVSRANQRIFAALE